MALIKYGGGIVQMSGSIAGDVHARNRFGNYMRARTTPINPKSDRQNVVRARIMLLAEAWNTELTAAQRTAWDSYADAIAWNNKLGETIKLTGFNHFIRSNAAMLQEYTTRIKDGPTTMSLPVGDPAFAVALSAASGITVTFDDGLDWCDEDNAYMFIEIGNPQNPTRTFFGGPWRYHASIDGDAITAPTTPDGPTAVTCWTLIEGHRVWVRGSIIRADGRLSTKFVAASVLVAA